MESDRRKEHAAPVITVTRCGIRKQKCVNAGDSALPFGADESFVQKFDAFSLIFFDDALEILGVFGMHRRTLYKQANGARVMTVQVDLEEIFEAFFAAVLTEETDRERFFLRDVRIEVNVTRHERRRVDHADVSRFLAEDVLPEC